MNAFAGMEMKQARRNRKHLPGAGEMAELLRSGLTVEEVAARYSISVWSVRGRVNDGGWTTEGHPMHEKAAPVAAVSSWALPDFEGPVNCTPDTAHLFFSTNPEATREAKTLCATCPARLACLSWALEHSEAGTWGGTTEDERAALTRGGAA